jgi:hypothetical protein
LAEAEAGNLHTAESFAFRAVEVRRDGFTLNTLGTILMRRATADASGALGYFDRAVEALSESRLAAVDGYEHPFVTFFEYTLRLVRMGHVERSQALRDTWQQWFAAALREPGFGHADLRQKLIEYADEWRKGGPPLGRGGE